MPTDLTRTSAEIRRGFLDFFASKGHQIVPSASLLPVDDPTLLFTNAGMNQFKEIFLGLRQAEHPRVADSQKCMRVSGKHNDLDDVGRSPFHHTLFEMLGNWSFGDYYKKEAIGWAWELLTGVWGLPKERLYATVFQDDRGDLGRDEEAAGYWRTETDITPDHVCFFGAKDNFWEMGETGPCGPCSEIHLDMGPEKCDKQSVPGHVCGVNGDCRRYIELWNLVFIQYNREKDGSLLPLPARHVDTGMGFERIVNVLQGADSNYDTDLFMPLIRRLQELLGHSDEERDANRVSYRVIADHGRAVTFLIGDGVMPGNEGRGYVLRLILRRAARHGRMLGLTRPFLAEIAKTVIELMGDPYDELIRRREFILRTIEQEEVRFSHTLATGLALLDEVIAGVKAQGGEVISGDDAFRLYDTFGFPLDITQDVARDHGLTVDLTGFQAALTSQQQKARASAHFGAVETAGSQAYLALLQQLREDGIVPPAGTAQDPYGAMTVETMVAALLRDGIPVPAAATGDQVEVVLPLTPFYVESGGQISDVGTIAGDGWEIQIADVRRPVPGLIVHAGQVLRGEPKPGDAAEAAVDEVRRRDIMRNHTATHLLNHALRTVLGKHVHQAGSVVAPDRLRFDFTHPNALSAAEAEAIELQVNQLVLGDYPVRAQDMKYRAAKAAGAEALFTEKYGDDVRVIKIGDEGDEFSRELCGGTHVGRTGEIGLFLIVSEESVGAGARRIEAVTGRSAYRLVRERSTNQDEAAAALHVPAEQLPRAVRSLQGEVSALQKELARLRADSAKQLTEQLASEAIRVGDASVVAAHVPSGSTETLREMTDWLRSRLGSAVVVLSTAVDGKPQIIAAVTDDLVAKGVHAGELVKAVAKVVGGGGGGKATLAQAGGRDLSRIDDALGQVPELVRKQLS